MGIAEEIGQQKAFTNVEIKIPIQQHFTSMDKVIPLSSCGYSWETTAAGEETNQASKCFWLDFGENTGIDVIRFSKTYLPASAGEAGDSDASS